MQLNLIFIISFIFFMPFRLWALSPTSNIQDLSRRQEDERIMKLLMDEKMFTAKELSFMKALIGLKSKILSGDLMSYHQIALFVNLHTDALRNNLSLYYFLEQFYLKYPKEDILKQVLRTVLLEIGVGIGVIDSQVKRNSGLIERMTFEGRLKYTDELMIFDDGQKALYVDVGISYGVETFQLMQTINRRIGRTQYALVAFEINATQYVLYDLKRKKKIFVNALGQAFYGRNVDPNIIQYWLDPDQVEREFVALYQSAFENMRKRLNEPGHQLLHSGDFVLEKLEVMDPRLKREFALGNAFLVEGDVLKNFPEKMDQINGVRIMNLLQYFNFKHQAQIILKFFRRLKRKGKIVFNAQKFTLHEKDNMNKDGSEFIFVLEKIDTNRAELKIYLHPKYRMQSLWYQFLPNIFNVELRAVRKMLHQAGIQFFETYYYHPWEWAFHREQTIESAA